MVQEVNTLLCNFETKLPIMEVSGSDIGMKSMHAAIMKHPTLLGWTLLKKKNVLPCNCLVVPQLVTIQQLPDCLPWKGKWKDTWNLWSKHKGLIKEKQNSSKCQQGLIRQS